MRVAVLLALAACGSGGDHADAGLDAPGVRCDPTAPFGAPVLVDGLNSDQDDVSARLTNDELTVVFGRLAASGNYDLWTASRANIADPFGAPALLTTVNSIYSDVWPTLSPDGLTLLFDSDRPTPGTSHVQQSTRASLTAPFGPPGEKAGLLANDRHPYLIASGSALYFSSATRSGLGMGDLYHVDVDPTGMLGTPAPVIGLVNSSDNEDAPAVTGDELRILFRHSTATESDVFTSTRATTSDPFGPPSPVEGLAVAGVAEVPNWVSPDGCHLYLHSNAPVMGGPMGVNLYVASRPL